MKLHLEKSDNTNTFTAYGEGYIAVNQEKFQQSLIVLPDQLLTDWCETSSESLSASGLEKLKNLGTEIILLGTGKKLRFPPKEVLKSFFQAGIGLEIMDTQAACRTYNILASEGRYIAAALIVD